MSQTFGESALRLSGVAAALLGWRPGEFWDATPAELVAALQPITPAGDGPDAGMMEALRRQFPDE